MEALMLTAKQRELLNFLTSYQAEFDHAPSFDEMKDAIGLKSNQAFIALYQRSKNAVISAALPTVQERLR